jgi:hypothetical protein
MDNNDGEIKCAPVCHFGILGLDRRQIDKACLAAALMCVAQTTGRTGFRWRKLGRN